MDLSVTFPDLMAYTADYLGWGKGAANGDKAWTARKLADLTFWVQRGVALFYNPPILPGDRTAYNWSFLYPTTTLALTQSTDTYLLPDDFEAIDGTVGVKTTERAPVNVRVVPARDIYQQQAARSGLSSQPLMVAVEPVKGTGPATGQKWQLLVYPPPDQDYTLDIRYKVAPQAPSETRPFVYGGQRHSNTVQAACIAAVEIHRDNITGGPRWQFFIECLKTSISLDRDLKPDLFGYNGDRSDRPEWFRDNRHLRSGIVTVNGVTPD